MALLANTAFLFGVFNCPKLLPHFQKTNQNGKPELMKKNKSYTWFK